MLDMLISTALIVTGIIHLLPLSGVLGAKRLAALYQLDLVEPNIQILMRHRAVLFGLLGVFLIYCAWQPALQLPGIGAGLISIVSFIVIARSVGNFNGAIRKVVIADVIALALLLIASISLLLREQ